MQSDGRWAQEADFADAHYSEWADQLDINEEFYRRYARPRFLWNWREHAASLVGSVEGKSLLDLGCGMGEEAIYFAKMGARVTAIDLSPMGIEIARRRAERSGLSDMVTARVMSATDTTFDSATFDVVHGLGILHHIGVRAGLAETFRLLKPSGIGIFLEPMENLAVVGSLKRAAFRLARKDLDVTEHEHPVTLSEMERYAKQFSRARFVPCHVIYRLRRLVPFGRLRTGIKVLDYYMLEAFPFLRWIAGGLVVYLQK